MAQTGSRQSLGGMGVREFHISKRPTFICWFYDRDDWWLKSWGMFFFLTRTQGPGETVQWQRSCWNQDLWLWNMESWNGWIFTINMCLWFKEFGKWSCSKGRGYCFFYDKGTWGQYFVIVFFRPIFPDKDINFLCLELPMLFANAAYTARPSINFKINQANHLCPVRIGSSLSVLPKLKSCLIGYSIISPLSWWLPIPKRNAPKTSCQPGFFDQFEAGKGKGKAPVVGVDGNWLCVQCQNAWSLRTFWIDLSGTLEAGEELQLLDECEMLIYSWLKIFLFTFRDDFLYFLKFVFLDDTLVFTR